MILMTTKLNSKMPLPTESKLNAEGVSFEGEVRIASYFAFETEILRWVKQFKGARWPLGVGGWYLLQNLISLAYFFGKSSPTRNH